MMNYSIIVPYHSNINLLQTCMQSLLATTPDDVEILIIANNPNSHELSITQFSDRCRIYKYQEELFYPKAMNIGVELAHGENLIFCDADTCYISGWFQALTSFHQRSPDIGLCSSKLLNPQNNRIIDFGIGFTQYNCPHPYKGSLHNHPLVTSNIKVQAACTANSCISKKVFREAGAFNELLVHSYSDIDLCLRLQSLGYYNWCIYNSLVYHKGASTVGSSMSNELKSDTKGVFWGVNSGKWVTDMDKYYSYSFKYLKDGGYKFQTAYYYIDLSTIADKVWHRELFSELIGAKYLESYCKPILPRDASFISLYETIDSNIRNLKCPLLFFVDEFTSLKNNAIWLSIRDVENDLIVDRHANVLPFSDIDIR